MRITEGQLRKVIRRALLAEDLTGFVQKTKDIQYTGDVRDPGFESAYSEHEGHKKKARSVKQAWDENADHDFMDSVIKIHWLKKDNIQKRLVRFLSMPRDQEISTMGYLPGTQTFDARWGPLGVVVRGWTTLAANDMNAIRSGYAGEAAEMGSKAAARKRPTAFYGGEKPEDSRAHEYILNRKSFNPRSHNQNEFIVANWEPTGIVISDLFLDSMGEAWRQEAEGGDLEPWDSVFRAFLGAGLPALEPTQVQIAEAWMEQTAGPDAPQAA